MIHGWNIHYLGCLASRFCNVLERDYEVCIVSSRQGIRLICMHCRNVKISTIRAILFLNIIICIIFGRVQSSDMSWWYLFRFTSNDFKLLLVLCFKFYCICSNQYFLFTLHPIQVVLSYGDIGICIFSTKKELLIHFFCSHAKTWDTLQKCLCCLYTVWRQPLFLCRVVIHCTWLIYLVGMWHSAPLTQMCH